MSELAFDQAPVAPGELCSAGLPAQALGCVPCSALRGLERNRDGAKSVARSNLGNVVLYKTY